MSMARVGMRVLRGPDWPGGDDSDGGEGHLGTVVSLMEGDRVRVLWDSGKPAMYRSGADGKFDLRVFDSGPVGVRHPDITCAACDEQNVFGMMWRCQSCRACHLCSLCYVTDKHDIKHDFLRFDQPGHSGQVVKKRSSSLKIRAMGMFPGAKVKRGKDWAWADQDGGEGNLGEVLGFENVASDSSRNIIRVQWPHGKTNSYRLGFRGNVDLLCVEEEAGTYYYRDHLPVLSKSVQMQKIKGDKRAGGGGGEITSVGLGDKVVVHVGEDQLKELQALYGGCTATMLRCIGKEGEVVSFAPNGAVSIKFEKIAFRFNPEAVIKVPSLSVGDMVQIRSDKQQVKLLNRRVTWKPLMEQMLGKVGQVKKIDSDGDVVVSFGNVAAMFSPGCCIPVAAFRDASSASSSSDDSDNYLENHQDLMMFVAEMLGIDFDRTGGSGGRGGGGNAMEHLMRAIAKGDLPSVRTLCQENKQLVNGAHKGMTPLITACHEGQKDICACLLALGADINKAGIKGVTPLAAALEGKKEQIAMFLLEKGANPNVKTAKDRNPVHLAAYHNDQFGDTPLHDAIERHNDDAVDMLVRIQTIDLQAQDRKGFNMLQQAALKGNAHAVERILSRDSGQVDKLFSGKYTALHIAANNDHVDCIKLLVSNGNAQVDLKGHNGLTPLHMACMKGHVRSMETLMELGALVNLQDCDGDSPLHLTLATKVDNPESMFGQLELKTRVRMACVLICKGAYPDLKNKRGGDPLQCSAHSGVRSAVQHFMKEK
ncbi:hypothetical protein ACOMHN_056792 [Nucella lapillus]